MGDVQEIYFSTIGNEWTIKTGSKKNMSLVLEIYRSFYTSLINSLTVLQIIDTNLLKLI